MESNNDGEVEHLKGDDGEDEHLKSDDGEDKHFKGDDGIMEFDGLITMKQSGLPMGDIVRSSEIINSSTPMERVIAKLVTTMQKITNECKEGNVTLCGHDMSHMKALACNIHNICLTKVNAFLRPRLVLHCIIRRWIGK
jgi:hypothetical protein